MKRFYCVCGESCERFPECRRTRPVIRACGRSNPDLGDTPAPRDRTDYTPADPLADLLSLLRRMLTMRLSPR